MTLGNEDVLASLAALLELLTHCDEDTKIETVQATALLGWRLLKEVKIKNQLLTQSR
ncbi:Uncharacterised protein [Serratia quinivorans]|uniref:hypothetical protein n=1 Tax=Serratia quinivorans TaxID=137545 RepID=UPI002179E635|nr:hypothetical protein [Serratia quinivorans]CAI1616704.1 Uncharacterised protein [Serratia quinivorans]CAI2395279.1 Uncharacterised protein [Serratia quinivorans]